MATLRKSLQRFAEDLQLFSGHLSEETQELQRNVEQKPIVGATHFRHCLEDIDARLNAVGEELQALESVSIDAISLEVLLVDRPQAFQGIILLDRLPNSILQELVGHCSAVYQANYLAIAELEQQLQQYGYRDVYAPLPPENPLDMLLLSASGELQQSCLILSLQR